MSNLTLQAYFYDGQMIIPTEGNLGQVWLSGYHFASNPQKIRQHNIKTVISAIQVDLCLPDMINHHKFDLRDNSEQEMRDLFYPIRRLMEEARKKGNVLIHCAAGVSRSASLLMAYMMHKYEKGFNSCLTYIQKRRECANPNPGFTNQLKQFASDLGVKEGPLPLK